MIKLYHGSSCYNINDMLDNPKATQNINGFGFYTTTSLQTAKLYGSIVYCYEVESLKYTQRPINRAWEDGISTYEECVKQGMEVVIVDVDSFILDEVVDAYVVRD